MSRTRRSRSIAAGAAALLTCAGALVAAAPADAAKVNRAPLTSAASSVPAALAVVGRSTRWTVVNDRSNGDVYLANPGGSTAPTVFARNAVADGLSGDLLTYRTADGVRHWRVLDTARTGAVPSTWAAVAPDGGLRVRTVGLLSYLDYLHLDGTTQSVRLPLTFPVNATYSIVASPVGVAVAASTTSGTPKLAFSTLSGASPTFTSLSTAGLPAGATLQCTSLASSAVGCIAPDRAVRAIIGSTTAPQISTLSSTPMAIAVTDGYTSWTTPHASKSTACPCDLISLGADGASLSAINGLTAGSLIGGNGRFFYTYGTSRGSAGVYVTAYAGGGAARIDTAPSRPLTATVPALGPGRAAWVDDSGANGPVRGAAVGPTAKAGAVQRIATGARLVPVGVSGLRTVYTTATGTLRRVYNGSFNTEIAKGTLLGVSGTRVLYRAANGHLVVRDLVAQRSLDATTQLGARSAALWGAYLSYGRADGSIWRSGAGGSHPVRLSAATSGTTTTRVAAWGDWTAWSVSAGRATTVAYRNARTLAAAHTLPAGRSLAGASAGGVLAGTAGRYELRSWAKNAVLTTIAANTGAGGASVPGAPSVDGTLYVSLVDGRPTVSTLGVAVTNRPRSLGNPSAPTTARRGSGWRLELPTSAALTSCTVTISRGTYRVQLPCTKSGLAAGEVLTTWHPGKGNGKIPALRYRWTVHAAGADGSLLNSTGTTAATTGTFVLS